MIANYYTLEELESLPTLCVGQADDLKVDENGTRVWLSRCSVEDGEPFAHKVTVERYAPGSGCWVEVGDYQAS